LKHARKLIFLFPAPPQNYLQEMLRLLGAAKCSFTEKLIIPPSNGIMYKSCGCPFSSRH
jgi:hypothetical protein